VDVELATTKELTEELLKRYKYGFIFLAEPAKKVPGFTDYYYNYYGSAIQILGSLQFFKRIWLKNEGKAAFESE